MQIDRERLAQVAHRWISPDESWDDCQGMQRYSRMLIGVFLADIEAQGFAVVPKVPTQEMVEAGVEHNPTSWTSDTDDGFPTEVVHEVWAAMIAGKEEG